MADRDVSKNPITQAEKDTWLRALRSGEYKQTRGKLKDLSGGYCCLGVACEVIGDGLVLREEKYLRADGMSRWWHVSGDISAEDTWGKPCYGWSDQAVVLEEAMAMNDEGHSFAEIADFLDVNLVPLEDMEQDA